MTEEQEMRTSIAIIKSNARKLRAGLYTRNYQCTMCSTTIGGSEVKRQIKKSPLKHTLTLLCGRCIAKENFRTQSYFKIINTIFYGG